LSARLFALQKPYGGQDIIPFGHPGGITLKGLNNNGNNNNVSNNNVICEVRGQPERSGGPTCPRLPVSRLAKAKA
jgi:hypothetical protein